MSNDFNDSELYPCDRCGKAFPVEEMYQLEDGGIICEDCYSEVHDSEE